MGAQVLRLPRLRGACAYHRVGIQVVIRIATIGQVYTALALQCRIHVVMWRRFLGF
jgi:hypothetical protein